VSKLKSPSLVPALFCQLLVRRAVVEAPPEHDGAVDRVTATNGAATIASPAIFHCGGCPIDASEETLELSPFLVMKSADQLEDLFDGRSQLR
jgi:hypothetical protein